MVAFIFASFPFFFGDEENVENFHLDIIDITQEPEEKYGSLPISPIIKGMLLLHNFCY